MTEHPRKYHLTSEGRQRLQDAAHRNQPWKSSTGPRTPQGKARAAANAISTGKQTDPATYAMPEQTALAGINLAGRMLTTTAGISPITTQMILQMHQLAERIIREGHQDHPAQQVAMLAWRKYHSFATAWKKNPQLIIDAQVERSSRRRPRRGHRTKSQARRRRTPPTP